MCCGPANCPKRSTAQTLLEQQDVWRRCVCTPGLQGYDLLAFFLERPFNNPPRRMGRVLDIDFGLASWEEEATMGVAAAGGFLFLR